MSEPIEERSGLIGDASVGAIGRIEDFPVVNGSGLGDTVVLESPGIRQVARELSLWVQEARGRGGRAAASQGLFRRDAYVPPNNPYDEMVAARRAVEEDDVVAGVADITEGYAFDVVKWEGTEADDSDVFNQWAGEVNLDGFLRESWLELFGASQFVVGTEWGWREYRVRGRGQGGRQRRRTYNLWVPTRLSVLDSSKVVPVGHSPMADEQLAWCGTKEELDWLTAAQQRIVDDPLMTQLFIGRYIPSQREKDELVSYGVDVENLMLMNPELVWRHSLTKQSYRRWTSIRLKSTFKLLDLKQQLINSDRATLIGAANYILLVRQGSDDLPGKPEEIKHLQQNFNFIAKLPVIISDQRLQVDIIAPKTDFTLRVDRYDVIDIRILMRCLGTLTLGNRGQRNETNVTISRAVARGIENRRKMIGRTLEAKVARAIFRHPRNAGQFTGSHPPSFVYVPARVALDIDAAFVQAILNARTRNELSRETFLEFFGFDQAVEAQRREIEAAQYDDIFQTFTPFDSPEHQGGRPAGGGESPANATRATDKTSAGNPSTGSGT